MKKIITTKARVSMIPHQRSLRRLFKRKLDSAIKRQDKVRQQELFDELMRALRNIEDAIEIMTHMVACQLKRGRQG